MILFSMYNFFSQNPDIIYSCIVNIHRDSYIVHPSKLPHATRNNHFFDEMIAPIISAYNPLFLTSASISKTMYYTDILTTTTAYMLAKQLIFSIKTRLTNLLLQ